jgi:uncharacterized SAM-binding protein YcdF (DUF218 family)
MESTVRTRRVRCGVLVVVAVALLVFVITAGHALILQVPLDRPDAIIALASHEWERLPEAARHARRYPAATVILTVPQQVTPFTCHDCANRVDRLGLLGVDRARVQVLNLHGPGTHAEAVSALSFARRSNVRRLLVVTSPYHTRRALAVFRKVFEGSGVDLGVEPAFGSSQARPATWWWHPDDRAYVPYEWAAMAYYVWTYGITPS